MTEAEAKEIVRAYEALVRAATESVGDYVSGYSDRHIDMQEGRNLLIRQELSVYDGVADVGAIGEIISEPFWLRVPELRNYTCEVDASA